MRAPCVVFVLCAIAACGGGGAGSFADAASTLDAAPLGIDAQLDEPCVAWSVHLAPETHSALVGAPTPGRCEGDGLAVRCVRRADATHPARTEGRLERVACATTERCQTFDVELRASPSGDQAPALVATLTGAACVPIGGPTFAMTWTGAAYAPVDAAPLACDGRHRLAAAGLPLPEVRFFADDPAPAGVPERTAWSALLGGYLAADCNAGDRCELIDEGSQTVCVDQGAVPCEASSCAGDERHVCRFGFTDGIEDCGASALACLGADPDGASCLADAEHRVVCAPPGSETCQGQNSCTADGEGYTYCDTTSCLMRVASCQDGQRCNPANLMCVDPGTLCDPAQTPEVCDGQVVRYCGAFSHQRASFDCAAFGMTCAEVGAAAGCVADATTACAVDAPPTCAGDRATYCCSYPSDRRVPELIFEATGLFRCIPGRLVEAACQDCAVSGPQLECALD